MDTCLQELVLENCLYAVPDELNMEKEIIDAFICA